MWGPGVLLLVLLCNFISNLFSLFSTVLYSLCDQLLVFSDVTTVMQTFAFVEYTTHLNWIRMITRMFEWLEDSFAFCSFLQHQPYHLTEDTFYVTFPFTPNAVN